MPLARSLLARQSQSNFPRSGTEFDSDCTRSIDREDVSKRVKKIIIKGGGDGGGRKNWGERIVEDCVYVCKKDD